MTRLHMMSFAFIFIAMTVIFIVYQSSSDTRKSEGYVTIVPPGFTMDPASTARVAANENDVVEQINPQDGLNEVTTGIESDIVYPTATGTPQPLANPWQP